MSEKSARAIALDLLVRTDTSGVYTNLALNTALKKYQSLKSEDRRFITALYYGVTERKITLDAIIEKYSKRADKLSCALRNILRLGLYQILYMDSVPESAAVNESVKLVDGEAKRGYANALLRSFIRDGCELPKYGVKLKDLSVKYSMPEWIIDLWVNDYGEKTALSLLENSLGKAPVTVRLNTLKYSESDIINELSLEGVSAEKPLDWLDGCYNISGGGSIENLSAYKKGMFHVQDISCQICAHELGAKPGDTVLDLCSAPGGKAFTIAELSGDGAHIYAYDLHKNRVRLIISGAERLGIKSITAGENNAKIFSDDIPLADKILCDVPCSGLGVIRRKPDIKYRPMDDVIPLSEIQYAILETSARYLKPGGILIYSTCTLRRAENDDITEKFLGAHPEFEPVKLNNFTDYQVSVTPDILPGDGFYIAKLRRKA